MKKSQIYRLGFRNNRDAIRDSVLLTLHISSTLSYHHPALKINNLKINRKDDVSLESKIDCTLGRKKATIKMNVDQKNVEVKLTSSYGSNESDHELYSSITGYIENYKGNIDHIIINNQYEIRRNIKSI